MPDMAEEYEKIKQAEKDTPDKQISKRPNVLMLRYERKSNPEICKKLKQIIVHTSKL